MHRRSGTRTKPVRRKKDDANYVAKGTGRDERITRLLNVPVALHRRPDAEATLDGSRGDAATSAGEGDDHGLTRLEDAFLRLAESVV